MANSQKKRKAFRLVAHSGTHGGNSENFIRPQTCCQVCTLYSQANVGGRKRCTREITNKTARVKNKRSSTMMSDPFQCGSLFSAKHCSGSRPGRREAADGHYVIIIRWNVRSCGVLRADGMTVAEGGYWHKEPAIGCEHRLTRIAADTNLLRGCNQPTNTHPAPEPSPLLRLP
jgi:hypothetical protein